MRFFVIALVILGMIFSSGCQTNPNGPAPQPVVPENPTEMPAETVPPVSPTQAAATPDRSERFTPKPIEKFVPAETVEPVTGEVDSELMNEILNDLVSRSGAAADQITVIRSQSIVWNDGSLGCPQPGQMYTQALVNGFWIVLDVDGQEYDYRAAESGYFFLCESGSAPILPTGAPVQ